MQSGTRIAAGICSLFAMSSAAFGQNYKVLGEYKIPGTHANAIAVDTVARRVFVTGDAGVVALDADTGAITGSVANLKGAQDVVLIPGGEGEDAAAASKGFASDD